MLEKLQKTSTTTADPLKEEFANHMEEEQPNMPV
jgi:hypothetical protein